MVSQKGRHDSVSARLEWCVQCLSPILSSSLSPVWSGCCGFVGLSPSLSLVLFSTWCGMLCPPPWSCLQSCVPFCLLAGLGSVGLSPSLSPVLSPMLVCGLCSIAFTWVSVSWLVSQFVSGLVSQHVSLSLCFFFVCVCLFESCVVHAVSPMLRVWFFGLVLFNGLYCYLAGKGETPQKAKFQLRFLLLFGVYGGVFFVFDCWRISGNDLLGDFLLVANQNCKKNSDLHDIGTFQNRIFHRP